MEGLRRLRRERGLTQQELAQEAGLTQHTISELELGRQTPRPSTLKKLARGLNVGVPELFGAEPGESPKELARRVIRFDPDAVLERVFATHGARPQRELNEAYQEARKRELAGFSAEELRQIRDDIDEVLREMPRGMGTLAEIRDPEVAERSMARIDLLEARLAVVLQLQAVAPKEHA